MPPGAEPGGWLLAGQRQQPSLPGVQPQELRTREGAGSADQHGAWEKATGLPWGPPWSKGGSRASSAARPFLSDQLFPKGSLAPTACTAPILSHPVCAALISRQEGDL